jgi:hypothetical protein
MKLARSARAPWTAHGHKPRSAVVWLVQLSPCAVPLLGEQTGEPTVRQVRASMCATFR